MKLGAAIAEIMKREGIEILCGYPVNHLIEYAAAADIRPIIVRQERIGLHMADAISRVTSGKTIGVFCMQHGPGSRERLWAASRRLTANRSRCWCCRWAMRAALANVDPQLQLQPCRCAASPSRPSRSRRRRESATSCGAPSPSCRTAAAGRCWSRSRPTCGTRKCRSRSNYTPVLRTRYGADPVACAGSRRAAGRGQAAGDLCRPGRALRRGLAAAEAARRAPRHPGHHQPRRQERLSGDASAVAGLGRPRGAARGAALPGEADRHLRHRLLLHRDQLRHRHAEGQDHHPRDARSRPISTRTSRPKSAWSAMPSSCSRRCSEEIGKTVTVRSRRRRRSPPRSRPRTRSGWRSGCRS